MKTLRFILVIAVTACMTALTGCSEDMPWQLEEEGSGRKPITFTSAHIEAVTRGQVVTEAPTEYKVSCTTYASPGGYATARQGAHFYNLTVGSDGSTSYVWPDVGTYIACYAYYPTGNPALALTSSADDTGFPVYTFTVPDDVRQHVDFMTADVTDLTETADGTIELAFQHRLSAFRFTFRNVTTDTEMKLVSIAMKNMKYTGTFRGTTWTPSAATKSFSLLLNGDTGTDMPYMEHYDVTGTDDIFIMMPQTIAAGTEMLDVVVEIAGVRKHFAYSPDAAFAIEAGHTYAMSINVAERISVENPMAITEWVMDVQHVDYATSSVTLWGIEPQPMDGGQSGGINAWTEDKS